MKRLSIRSIALGPSLYMALCMALGLMALAAPSHAWNDSGHRAIAIAALRMLPAQTQRAVLETLSAHPRYKQDFLRLQPRDPSPFSVGEWQIGQAATWPDLARGFEHAWFWQRDSLRKRYHRGRWHYINFPVYLDSRDRALQIPDPSQRCTLADCAENPGNVLEALDFIQDAFAQPSSEPAQLGLWLAWALHLLADAHQPLHSTALFSIERWPNGDRGGNDIQVGQELNLHAFWDRALLAAGGATEIDALVGRLLAPEFAPKLALGNEPVDVVGLLRESHAVAIEFVYDPILGALRAAKNDGPITLDDTYVERAASAAQRQGRRAVLRTAQWLQYNFGT